MFNDTRIFRRSDPDFPTTPATQRALVAAGRVAGEGPLAVVRKGELSCHRCGHNIDADLDADRNTSTCGTCRRRPHDLEEEAGRAHAFSETERSLIGRTGAYMPRAQLLSVLNDRLRCDRGPAVALHTIEQLDAEIRGLTEPKASIDHGWAGLRRLLAQARKSGTLGRINEQVINDFAIVFSLSPKHLMRLRDTLLKNEED